MRSAIRLFATLAVVITVTATLSALVPHPAPVSTVIAPPLTGQGMQSEAGALPWTAAALAASGTALAGLGAATLRRTRR